MTSRDANTDVGAYPTGIAAGGAGSHATRPNAGKDTPSRKSIPKEGSNRGHEVDGNARANITDTISGRPPKRSSDDVDDGRPGHADETKAKPTLGAADRHATRFKRSL